MKTIVVLGMHRSGSSLLGNILYHLGVNLGPRHLLGKADRANEAGYYENMAFVDVNERALAAAGCSWRRPPWHMPERVVHEFRNEAAALVEKFQSELWGWKDNRNVFTWPLYESHLRNVHFVVSCRRLESVVDSLMRAHYGTPLNCTTQEEALIREEFKDLVMMHYAKICEIVSQTEFPAIFVDYGTFFDAPTYTLSRIARFLGVEIPADFPSLIDAKLRHFE